MGSLEPYLEQACARLKVNPAEIQDIREELSCHLEELIEKNRSEGMTQQEAMDHAIASFGDSLQIKGYLELVHGKQYSGLFITKGVLLGMLAGVSLCIPLFFLSRLMLWGKEFPVPPWLVFSAPVAILNNLVMGGIVGYLVAKGRRLHFAAALVSVIWLLEYFIYWVFFVVLRSGSMDFSWSLMQVVVAAPLLGFLFAFVSGAFAKGGLLLLIKIRPQIR